MKNIFKIILSFLLIASVNSCKESDNVIDEVLQYETGAVLRTIDVISNTLNSSDPDSEWRVALEEQDKEDGALFQQVDIYVSLKDLSPENGTAIANEVFVKTIPASEFAPGPHGLPRGEVAATYGEAFAAIGLPADQISPGDLFIFETRLVLTDGREFGAASATGIITGGYFSSPFEYNALIVCSPEPGVYTIDMHDSYGDGWQTDSGAAGSGITVTLTNPDGSQTVLEFGMCSPYAPSDFDCTPNDGYNATTTIEIPVGTVLAIWNFTGDRYGEIGFEVYAPDGTQVYAAGFGETAPGILPIAYCVKDAS
jgi:hypothetical protein